MEQLQSSSSCLLPLAHIAIGSEDYLIRAASKTSVWPKVRNHVLFLRGDLTHRLAMGSPASTERLEGFLRPYGRKPARQSTTIPVQGEYRQ